MKTPTIMGQPLWFGKIKGRVAKKHLERSIRPSNYKEWFAAMSNLKEGDLICDCSAFNVRVAKIEPKYMRVGKNGFVLVDILITNNQGGLCSLTYCNVQPGLSRETIIKNWQKRVDYYKANGDQWDFAKRYEFTTVDQDGQAVIDFSGLKDKYGV